MTYLEKSFILRYIRESDALDKLVKAYDVLPYNFSDDDKNTIEVWEAYRNRLSEFYGDFMIKSFKKK